MSDDIVVNLLEENLVIDLNITEEVITVVVSEEGTQGPAGAQGLIGPVGPGAVYVILDRFTVVVPSDSTGTISDYTNTGASLKVYEGDDPLVYDGLGSSPGTYMVTTRGFGISPGSVSETGGLVNIGTLANMSADNAYCILAIVGKTIAGVSFSRSVRQNVTKIRNGYTPQKGIDYVDGNQGLKGDQGDIGLTGPKGDKGDTGEAAVPILPSTLPYSVLTVTPQGGMDWMHGIYYLDPAATNEASPYIAGSYNERKIICLKGTATAFILLPTMEMNYQKDEFDAATVASARGADYVLEVDTSLFEGDSFIISVVVLSNEFEHANFHDFSAENDRFPTAPARYGYLMGRREHFVFEFYPNTDYFIEYLANNPSETRTQDQIDADALALAIANDPNITDEATWIANWRPYLPYQIKPSAWTPTGGSAVFFTATYGETDGIDRAMVYLNDSGGLRIGREHWLPTYEPSLRANVLAVGYDGGVSPVGGASPIDGMVLRIQSGMPVFLPRYDRFVNYGYGVVAVVEIGTADAEDITYVVDTAWSDKLVALKSRAGGNLTLAFDYTVSPATVDQLGTNFDFIVEPWHDGTGIPFNITFTALPSSPMMVGTEMVTEYTIRIEQDALLRKRFLRFTLDAHQSPILLFDSGGVDIPTDRKVTDAKMLVWDAKQEALTAGTDYATPAMILEEAQVKHGFQNQTDTSIKTPMVGSLFTLTKVNNYSVAIGGINHILTASLTCDLSLQPTWSVTATNNYGQWFVYMTISGGLPVLAARKTPWSLQDLTIIPVVTITWDGVAYKVWEERHGWNRNLENHELWHNAFGAQYISGFTPTPTFGSSANNTFAFVGGVTSDEGIYNSTIVNDPLYVTDANSHKHCVLAYRQNAGAAMKFDAPSTTFAKLSGNAPVYDNNGVLTIIAGSSYGVTFMYATNSVDTPIVGVIGQGQYTSVALAQAAPTPTLGTVVTTATASGMNVAEWKLLYLVVYRNVGGNLLFNRFDVKYNLSTGPAIIQSAASLGAGMSNVNGVVNISNSLTIGDPTTTTTGQTAPILNLGNSVANTAGDYVKICLFDTSNGLNTAKASFGFGLSASQLDYLAPSNATHNFFINGIKIFQATEALSRVWTNQLIVAASASGGAWPKPALLLGGQRTAGTEGVGVSISLFDSVGTNSGNTGHFGFGIAGSTLTYVVPAANMHKFYIGGVLSMMVNAAYVQVATGIKMLVGAVAAVTNAVLEVTGNISCTTGIKLGNSANADSTYLDYYDEGTTTPVLAAVNALSVTYTRNWAKWNRIGNRVFVEYELSGTINSGTAADVLSITGMLPFNAVNPYVGGAHIPAFRTGFLHTGSEDLGIHILNGQNICNLVWNNTTRTSFTSLTYADKLASTFALMGNFSYSV